MMKYLVYTCPANVTLVCSNLRQDDCTRGCPGCAQVDTFHAIGPFFIFMQISKVPLALLTQCEVL